MKYALCIITLLWFNFPVAESAIYKPIVPVPIFSIQTTLFKNTQQVVLLENATPVMEVVLINKTDPEIFLLIEYLVEDEIWTLAYTNRTEAIDTSVLDHLSMNELYINENFGALLLAHPVVQPITVSDNNNPKLIMMSTLLADLTQTLSFEMYKPDKSLLLQKMVEAYNQIK